jgi:hypothetical protein
MMARQLLEDAEIIYSTLPETAVNTPYVAITGFKSALVNSGMPPIPKPTRIKNDMIGGQNEFGRKARNNYWPSLDVPIGGMLNSEIAADFARRAWGGVITHTLVATGVYDHIIALQTKTPSGGFGGRIPMLTTFAWLLGGYNFLHASCAIDNFEIGFDGDTSPSWSATLRNTGYSFRRLSDADISADMTPTPTVPTYNLFHPAGVKATFNDGSLKDFGADARLISGRCGINNQIVVKPHQQDPFRVTSPAIDRTSGAYMRDIHRSKRVFVPTLKASMDETLAEFVTSRDLTDVTNLTYLFEGDLIGATVYARQFEVKYPLSTMEVDSDTDDTDAAISLSFDIDREDAVGGIAILRIRDGNPTL